jgi:hypothetical protein
MNPKMNEEKRYLFQNYTAEFDFILNVKQPLDFGGEKPILISHIFFQRKSFSQTS